MIACWPKNSNWDDDGRVWQKLSLDSAFSCWRLQNFLAGGTLWYLGSLWLQRGRTNSMRYCFSESCSDEKSGFLDLLQGGSHHF